MNKDLKEKFVIRLEFLINRNKISKAWFCDFLGISRQTFCNWKKQKSLPSAETLLKIANYFKVDPNWLVFGSTKIPDNNFDIANNSILSKYSHISKKGKKIVNELIDYIFDKENS